MRKFILDLEFNEVTGTTRIVVDFNDNSMSNLEINEAIKSGEMLDAIIEQAEKIFGEQLAKQVRNGQIAAVCLDNHPELRNNDGGILINEPGKSKQEIKQ